MSQGLIQGSMSEAPLPDIIQLVSQGGKTGCFHVTDDLRRARIYLKDGRIVHAVSNECEGLDAVYEVALWLEGHYHFEENGAGVETTITKPNPSILMEMHRRMDEWRVISQRIPSLDLHPHTTLLPGEAPTGVNPREARLLGVVTGYYTVAELAEVMEKPVLNIAKDLYGLIMAGHVVLKGVRSGKRPDIAGKAPEAVKAEVPQQLPEVVKAEVPQQLPEAAAVDPFEALAAIEPAALPEVPVQPAAPEASAPVFLIPGPAIPEARVELRPRPQPQGPAQDPVKLAKLTNFTQRIMQTAKGALPAEHHEMAQRLQARAHQQLMAGEGPEAVKNLALAISRGAVEAGCDGDTVKNLNAHLKALFAK